MCFQDLNSLGTRPGHRAWLSILASFASVLVVAVSYCSKASRRRSPRLRCCSSRSFCSCIGERLWPLASALSFNGLAQPRYPSLVSPWRLTTPGSRTASSSRVLPYLPPTGGCWGFQVLRHVAIIQARQTCCSRSLRFEYYRVAYDQWCALALVWASPYQTIDRRKRSIPEAHISDDLTDDRIY
jgi:hypothetical protein